MPEAYHFTESGLDYVRLTSGYLLRETKAGPTVRFVDMQGLMATIGRLMVETKRKLQGQDIRFLRTELDLSQAAMASRFGVTERTVIRWENDKVPIPATADALLRAFYLEQQDGKPHASEALGWVGELQEQQSTQLVLEYVDGEWQQQAA